MTKATRIINKYHIKEILLNGNPQFENFYKEELIQFCEVAREMLKQYQKENQELKKQLEETDRKLFFTKNELDMREKTIDNKLIQQKEFIKYLEDMLDDENDIFSVVRIKDVLQKYKEIIGVEK